MFVTEQRRVDRLDRTVELPGGPPGGCGRGGDGEIAAGSQVEQRQLEVTVADFAVDERAQHARTQIGRSIEARLRLEKADSDGGLSVFGRGALGQHDSNGRGQGQQACSQENELEHQWTLLDANSSGRLTGGSGRHSETADVGGTVGRPCLVFFT